LGWRVIRARFVISFMRLITTCRMPIPELMALLT